MPRATVTVPPGENVNIATSPTDELILKHRFPKLYRHAALSAALTAQRTALEARALVRCAREGVVVPQLRLVDEKQGIIAMQLVDGRSIRQWLGGDAEAEQEDEIDMEEEENEDAEEDEVLEPEDQVRLMALIGTQLASMHAADVIHGDLTTSNMMLRRHQRQERRHGVEEGDQVVIIDFGLTSNSIIAEDKAVDLYVLERAFASTHPASEHLFAAVLASYASETTQASKRGAKGPKWEEISKRLEEVRLRGRKRSMVG